MLLKRFTIILLEPLQELCVSDEFHRVNDCFIRVMHMDMLYMGMLHMGVHAHISIHVHMSNKVPPLLEFKIMAKEHLEKVDGMYRFKSR